MLKKFFFIILILTSLLLTSSLIAANPEITFMLTADTPHTVSQDVYFDVYLDVITHNGNDKGGLSLSSTPQHGKIFVAGIFNTNGNQADYTIDWNSFVYENGFYKFKVKINAPALGATDSLYTIKLGYIGNNDTNENATDLNYCLYTTTIFSLENNNPSELKYIEVQPDKIGVSNNTLKVKIKSLAMNYQGYNLNSSDVNIATIIDNNGISYLGNITNFKTITKGYYEFDLNFNSLPSNKNFVVTLNIKDKQKSFSFHTNNNEDAPPTSNFNKPYLIDNDTLIPSVNYLALNRTTTNTNQAIIINGAATDEDSGLSNIIEVQYNIDSDFIGGSGNSIVITPNTKVNFSFTLDTTLLNTLSDGVHNLYVKAKDFHGNWSNSQIISFTVDRSAIISLIVNPIDNSVIGGGVFKISGSLSNPLNTPIQAIRVCVDNSTWDYATNKGINYATWEYSLDTTTYPDGLHTIEVQAIDTNNNIHPSTRVQVEFDNTLPLTDLIYPTNGQKISGPQSIYGMVKDKNLDTWEVKISPQGQNNWTTLASGNSEKEGNTFAHDFYIDFINGQADNVDITVDGYIKNIQNTSTVNVALNKRIGGVFYTNEDLKELVNGQTDNNGFGSFEGIHIGGSSYLPLTFIIDLEKTYNLDKLVTIGGFGLNNVYGYKIEGSFTGTFTGEQFTLAENTTDQTKNISEIRLDGTPPTRFVRITFNKLIYNYNPTLIKEIELWGKEVGNNYNEGTYISPIIGGDTTTWRFLKVIGDPQISIYYRHGNSNSIDGTWSNWQGPFNFLTIPLNFSSKYIQYKIVFPSTNNLIQVDKVILGSGSNLGNFDFSTLPDGFYDIQFFVKDKANNQKIFNYTVEKFASAPLNATWAQPSAGSVVGKDVVISGTIANLVSVDRLKINIDNGNEIFYISPSNNWSFVWKSNVTNNSNHTINVAIITVTGEEIDLGTRIITINNEIPLVDITNVNNGSWIGNSGKDISIKVNTTNPINQWILKIGKWDASINGTVLASGNNIVDDIVVANVYANAYDDYYPYELLLEATDIYGNKNVIKKYIYFDETPSTIGIDTSLTRVIKTNMQIFATIYEYSGVDKCFVFLNDMLVLTINNLSYDYPGHPVRSNYFDWDYDGTLLPEGSYVLKMQILDKAGNLSNIFTGPTIILDSTPPIFSFKDEDNKIIKTSQDILASFSDNYKIKQVQLQIFDPNNNTISNYFYTNFNQTSYTDYTVGYFNPSNYNSGVYTIKGTIHDTNDNFFTNTIHYLVDNIKPQIITMGSPSSVGRNYIFKGIAYDDYRLDKIEINIDNNGWQPILTNINNTFSEWSYVLDQSWVNGSTHNIQIRSIDWLGNVSNLIDLNVIAETSDLAITSVFPENTNPYISPDTLINATFNRNIDPITINDTNIELWDLTLNTRIEKRLILNNNVINIKPSSLLIPGHSYRVIINNLKDIYGNSSSFISWDFDIKPNTIRILSPHDNTYISNLVDIFGNVLLKNLTQWQLKFKALADSSWTLLTSGNTPLDHNVIEESYQNWTGTKTGLFINNGVKIDKTISAFNYGNTPIINHSPNAYVFLQEAEPSDPIDLSGYTNNKTNVLTAWRNNNINDSSNDAGNPITRKEYVYFLFPDDKRIDYIRMNYKDNKLENIKIYYKSNGQWFLIKDVTPVYINNKGVLHIDLDQPIITKRIKVELTNLNSYDVSGVNEFGLYEINNAITSLTSAFYLDNKIITQNNASTMSFITNYYFKQEINDSINFVLNQTAFNESSKTITYSGSKDGLTWTSFSTNLSSVLPARFLQVKTTYNSLGSLIPIVTNETLTFRDGSSTHEYISTIIDASAEVFWSKIKLDEVGGNARIFYRYGNSAIPDGTWTPWAETTTGQINKKSRFIQYKLLFNEVPLNYTMFKVFLYYFNNSFYTWDTNSLPSGTYQLRLEATNTENDVFSDEKQIIIENVKPTVAITSPTDGSYFGGSTTTITGISSDDLSGVQRTEININNTGWVVVSLSETSWQYTFDNTIFANGTTISVAARSFDNAGNVSDTTTIYLTCDRVSPITTISSNYTPNANGWDKKPITVTLSANKSGSTIFYQITSQYMYYDTQAWLVYTGPLTINSDGVTRLWVYSRDSLGNTEIPKYVEYSIDKTPPTLTPSYISRGLAPDNNYYTNSIWGNVIIREPTSGLIGSNAVKIYNLTNSGVNSYYSAGKSTSIFVDAISIPSPLYFTPQTIRFEVYDKAGNVGVYDYNIIIDNAPPTLVNNEYTYTPDKTIYNYKDNVLNRVHVQDSSGIKYIYYRDRLSSASISWVNKTDTLTEIYTDLTIEKNFAFTSYKGKYEFSFGITTIEDWAGNRLSLSYKDSIWIDGVEPLINISNLDPFLPIFKKSSDTINIIGSVTENETGLARFEYRFIGDNRDNIYYPIILSGNNFNFIISNLPSNNGNYQIELKATDNSGLTHVIKIDLIIDNSPPPAIAKLKAKPDNTLGGINLTWEPARDGETEIDYYLVYRDGNLVTPISLFYLDGTLSIQPEFYANVAVDKMMTSDTIHNYVIVAVDKAGNKSALSNIAAALYDTQAPSVPSNLVVTNAGTAIGINISWNESTDNIGIGGYVVERSIDGTNFTEIGHTRLGTSALTRFYDKNVTPGQIYYYRVKAYDKANPNPNYSGYSQVKSAVAGLGLSYVSPHGDYDNPARNNYCNACHITHNGKAAKLLNQQYESSVCYRCHDGTGSLYSIKSEINYNPTHHRVITEDEPLNLLNCTNCHDPHGNPATSPKLLRSKDKFGNIRTRGTEFCLSCHGDEGIAPNPGGSQSEYLNSTHISTHNPKLTPMSEPKVECLRCHENHGSPYFRQTIQNEDKICFQCHDERTNPGNNRDGWDIWAQFNPDLNAYPRASRHGIEKAGATVKCTSCHGQRFIRNNAFDSPESEAGISSDLSDPTNIKKMFTKADGDYNDFCIKCHGSNPPKATSTTNVIIPYTIEYPANDITTSANGWDRSSFKTPGVAHYDAGYTCRTCHHSHGTNYPRLVYLPEDSLTQDGICFSCHGNAPRDGADNIKQDFQKTYRHPIAEGKHNDSENYKNMPSNKRHAACTDCHDPHTATKVKSPLGSPKGAGTQDNISGVKVINGAAGTQPQYRFLSRVELEYELCFKCHSGYAYGSTPPAGQSDYSILFNPNNASYHPVEAKGKNPDIPDEAFVNGWKASSLVKCTDCHGSDNSGKAGPHGSIYPKILKKPINVPRSDPNMLCYECHNYITYNNNQNGASRYYHKNNGHVKACTDCHTVHGSANYKRLGDTTYLTIDPINNVMNFKCVTCHGNLTYYHDRKAW